MEFILQMSQIVPRNDWLHFRQVIPEELRNHPEFKGRREITRTLKTKDPILAKQRAAPLIREWKSKIESAQRRGKGGIFEALPVKPSDIVERFVEKEIYGNPATKLHELNKDLLQPCLQTFEILASADEPDMVRFLRQVTVWSEVFDCEMMRPLLAGLSARDGAKLVLGIVNKMRTKLIEELAFSDLKTIPVYDRITEKIAHQEANPPKPLLSEILKRVIAQDPDREARMNGHIGNLIEWSGDKSCDQYSFEDLISYRNECLLSLPDRRGGKYQDMPLRQAIKAADPEDVISRATIDNHLTSIRTVFKYAAKHEGVSIDTEGLLPKKIKTQHDNAPERRYSIDELQKMVNLLPTVKKSPARFWAPLISLYQGSRLNETCQLHTKDVRIEKDTGIWIIDLNGENDGGTNKRIKTASSWRKVPVHPTLIKLGFISFVETRKQETQGENALLFHDVKWSEKHSYTRPVGRWFGEGFKQEFLSTERAKVLRFHSLRHTFAQQAQNQSRMGDRIRRELGGWDVGETAEHYSGRHSAENLLPALSELDYGLNLSPIMGLY